MSRPTQTMSFGENDYISFTEFLQLIMTEYIIENSRAKKISQWCIDATISASDIYYADTENGKKTRFYNRNDQCVLLTKKKQKAVWVFALL
tara:strand:- start:494 stop:766 length:273 start_codon:yes stop_codon:yes gene_type:complete